MVDLDSGPFSVEVLHLLKSEREWWAEAYNLRTKELQQASDDKIQALCDHICRMVEQVSETCLKRSTENQCSCEELKRNYLLMKKELEESTECYRKLVTDMSAWKEQLTKVHQEADYEVVKLQKTMKALDTTVLGVQKMFYRRDDDLLSAVTGLWQELQKGLRAPQTDMNGLVLQRTKDCAKEEKGLGEATFPRLVDNIKDRNVVPLISQVPSTQSTIQENAAIPADDVEHHQERFLLPKACVEAFPLSSSKLNSEAAVDGKTSDSLEFRSQFDEDIHSVGPLLAALERAVTKNVNPKDTRIDSPKRSVQQPLSPSSATATSDNAVTARSLTPQEQTIVSSVAGPCVSRDQSAHCKRILNNLVTGRTGGNTPVEPLPGELQTCLESLLLKIQTTFRPPVTGQGLAGPGTSMSHRNSQQSDVTEPRGFFTSPSTCPRRTPPPNRSRRNGSVIGEDSVIVRPNVSGGSSEFHSQVPTRQSSPQPTRQSSPQPVRLSGFMGSGKKPLTPRRTHASPARSI